MGDMVEKMQALQQVQKERRQEKASVNIEQLTAMHIPAKEQSKNVFRVDTNQGAVMYYPPSGKWQHRGRVMKGDVMQFREWLRREHFIH